MSSESKIPTNHVVGIIKGNRSANEALERLHQTGYDDILVMYHVDNLGQGVNPLSALIERLSGPLSDETGYLDQYEEAAEQGDVVLAVGARHGAEADRVRVILEREGAVNIRYFGKLPVTDMTPSSNPSAPSDIQPQGPKHPASG